MPKMSEVDVVWVKSGAARARAQKPPWKGMGIRGPDGPDWLDSGRKEATGDGNATT